MLTFKLPSPQQFKALQGSIEFDEHCLYTEQVQSTYQMPEHAASLSIVHSIYGSGEVKLNGQKNKIDQNTFLVVNQNSFVSMTSSDSQPLLLYFQYGVPALVASSLYHSPEKLIDEPDSHFAADFSLLERVHPASASLKSRLRLLASLPDSCSSFLALKTDAVVRSIIEEILIANNTAALEASRLDVVRKSTRNEIYKRLYTARDWMEAYFDRPLTLLDISSAANLNSQHFLRLFKQVFLKTPHQYLIDLRLEEAKRLIIDTEIPISDICLRVGWESLASFSKMFKKKIGVSPMALRRVRRSLSGGAKD